MDRHQLLFMNPTAKKELTEDDLTCVICSVLFIEPMTLNCAHIFCRLCLYKWLALKSTCPVCRRHVDEVLKSNEQLTSDIKQDNPPYNKGAFKIEINFPAEYPFKPPKINFKTKIYHPNIDEKGQVCLPIISAENWKPATKTDQVIQALVALVNEPEPEHPLRADLAEEYLKDKKKFTKNAEEFTKKHCEKRPSD